MRSLISIFALFVLYGVLGNHLGVALLAGMWLVLTIIAQVQFRRIDDKYYRHPCSATMPATTIALLEQKQCECSANVKVD